MKTGALALISTLGLALPAVALAQSTTGDKPTTSSTDSSKTTGGEKTGKLSEGDIKIVSHLHHVNQMEIDLARTAQKSGTAAIKTFAATLISDHQSADKDLMAFAKKHTLSVIPSDKADTDADRQMEKDMQSQVSHLKMLKGADFDKEFLNMMAAGHDKEIAKVDVAIGAATNTDLQDLLKQVKPVMQRHADQARDLLKNPQASMNSRTKDSADSPSTSAPSPSEPSTGSLPSPSAPPQ